MKLIWSERSKQDIQEIIDYYKPRVGVRITQTLVRKIYAGALFLVTNPMGGQYEILFADKQQMCRRVIVGNYKIVYRVEAETVYIITVFDCRRNPVSLRAGLVDTKV